MENNRTNYMNYVKYIAFLMFFFMLSGCLGGLDNRGDLTEKNKEVVVNFYKGVFADHLVAKTANEYIGDVYIQHNPNVPDGKEVFITHFEKHFKQNPKAVSEIKKVIAEGDLVVLHVLSKVNPEDKGRAIIDIFRLEGGKIVEHWDVIQAIPEKSANDNGMF